MSNTSSKKFTKTFEIKTPGVEHGLGVSTLDWAHLKNKIKKIKPTPILWSSISTFCFGIGGTALFSIFTLNEEVSKYGCTNIFICKLFLVVSVIVAFLCGYFALQQRKVSVSSVRDVLDEIEKIENEIGLSNDNQE